jgi:hypothetical protein
MTTTRSQGSDVGRVVAIWRYPVKSMMGEELSATEVTQHGLLGDRASGLVDVVITTLSQGSLSKDAFVLRTAVQDNGGNVGVYARVVADGEVCREDVVELA